jgi:hypothetical protein
VSQDPIDRLRDELVAAAKRKQIADARRLRRRRHGLIGGLGAMLVLVGAPIAASLTGVVELGSGTTRSGKTYTVEQLGGGVRVEGGSPFEGRRGEICQRIRVRDAAGELIVRTSACHAATSDEVVLGSAVFMAQLGEGVLVSGSVPSEVATVEVSGARPPELLSVAGTDRRAFIALSSDAAPVVTALNDDTDVVGRRRFELPEPSR